MLKFLPALYFLGVILIPGATELGVLVLALLGLVVLLRWRVPGAVGLHSFQWQSVDSRLSLAFALVFLFKFLSMLWADQPRLALSNALWHLHFLLWPLVLLGLHHCGAAQRDVERAVAAGLVAVAAWFVVFKLSGERWLPFEDAGSSNLGVLAQMTLFLGTWNLLALSRPGVDWRTADGRLKAAAFVAAWVVMIASTRRLELLGLLLVTASVLAYRLRSRLTVGRLLVLVLGVVALTGLMVFLRWEKFETGFTELSNYFALRGKDPQVVLSSWGARLEMYRVGWLGFMDHPWLGMSAGARPYLMQMYGAPGEDVFGHRHFHSEILQTLVEGGVVWLVLLASAVAYAVRQMVIKPWRDAPELSLMALGLLGAYAIEGVFSAALIYGEANGVFVVASAWVWLQLRQQRSGA
jgi:O-antigen ligase